MQPLVRGDEPVVRGHGRRMRNVLASTRAVGRRHLSKWLYMLAFFGVPVGVIAGSGGVHTIAFWIMTLVWVAAVVYGTVLVLFILFIVISPIVLVLERVVPEQGNTVVAVASKVLVVVIAAVAFVEFAQLGEATGVRLPTASPNLGALVVMSVAAVSGWGLVALGARYKLPKRHPGYQRRHSVPEPDEEFWSDQAAVGWRAWNWDGSSLRGVYAQWPTQLLEASCPHCDVVPSWDHVCGIYAAKRPADVHVFHGGSSIVGRVELWGDVIEHEYGYRASHARITSLWVGDHWRAERIRAAYPGVEVAVGVPHIGQEVA